jgi:hypothetical protein
MTVGSRAVDGPGRVSGHEFEAGGAFKSSAASVTSLVALRRLAIFRMLFWCARTTYSLPILTIE